MGGGPDSQNPVAGRLCNQNQMNGEQEYFWEVYLSPGNDKESNLFCDNGESWSELYPIVDEKSKEKPPPIGNEESDDGGRSPLKFFFTSSPGRVRPAMYRTPKKRLLPGDK